MFFECLTVAPGATMEVEPEPSSNSQAQAVSPDTAAETYTGSILPAGIIHLLSRHWARSRGH